MLQISTQYMLISLKRTVIVWNLYEQMAVAALDSGKIDLADVYVNKLVKQFPDSLRVKRLEGMVMEYEGDKNASFCYF